MVRCRQLPCWLAILAMSGCKTVGPDYAVPKNAAVNAPAARGAFVSGGSATTAAEPPQQWWKLFDDSVLDNLIARALETNTDLRVAQANLARSDALLQESRTLRRPDGLVDAETSWVQQSAESVLQHVQPPERQIYNTGITVSYDLDLFGGLRRGVEAAQADDDAAVAARDLARINVAAETARAYADICNMGHQLDVTHKLLDLQQKDLRLTRVLVVNGRAPDFDQTRQEGLLANTRSALPLLEARQRNAVFRVTTLLGKAPAEFDPSLLGCHSPLHLRSLLPTGDGAAALARRPDVRAAERRVAAATARIGVATAQLYPDVKLGVSAGSTGAAKDLMSALTNRFGVGPLISWDLRRSTVRARIAGAEAQTRANIAAFDSVVLTSLREVETTLDSYAADLDRLAELKVARDDAQRVAERTAELRHGGRVSALVALDAERTEIAAEQAVAVAEGNINGDQVAVFLALGGGWGATEQ